MQNKLLIIQQFFGIGDIIFTQTIANDFIKAGYKVLWPVLPQFVEGLNRAYPNVVFIDKNLVHINYENKEYKEEGGVTYLPMRYSEWLMKKPYLHHMESKYSYLGKDWRTWKEHAMPVRNSGKEKELAKILGISEGDKYNLVSTSFGSSGTHSISIDVNNDYKNIELYPIESFSLFDWCGIIEGAETIHAVSSATLYLLEILNLSTKEVHIYPRKPIEQDLRFVEFLMTKNYIKHA